MAIDSNERDPRRFRFLFLDLRQSLLTEPKLLPDVVFDMTHEQRRKNC